MQGKRKRARRSCIQGIREEAKKRGVRYDSVGEVLWDQQKGSKGGG